MVRLVQLVEHQIVVLGVVGSSPTSHPKFKDCPFRTVFFIWGAIAIDPPAPPGDKGKVPLAPLRGYPLCRFAPT